MDEATIDTAVLGSTAWSGKNVSISRLYDALKEKGLKSSDISASIKRLEEAEKVRSYCPPQSGGMLVRFND